MLLLLGVVLVAAGYAAFWFCLGLEVARKQMRDRLREHTASATWEIRCDHHHWLDNGLAGRICADCGRTEAR